MPLVVNSTSRWCWELFWQNIKAEDLKLPGRRVTRALVGGATYDTGFPTALCVCLKRSRPLGGAAQTVSGQKL